MTVEIHDADPRLSELTASVTNGEDVILLREGKPFAKLTPLTGGQPKRRIGLLEGVYEIPADFDTMFDKEIEEMFNGDSSE